MRSTCLSAVLPTSALYEAGPAIWTLDHRLGPRTHDCNSDASIVPIAVRSGRHVGMIATGVIRQRG